MDRKLDSLRLPEGIQVSYYGFLDAEDQDIWRELLQEQVVFLKRQGWPEQAIKEGYLRELEAPDNREEHVTYLQERLAESQVFGSALFQKMWRIASREGRVKDLRQLLKAGMRVVKMPDDLSGDLAETQELLNRLALDLEPAAPFWKLFSQTVQRAFPGQTLAGEGKLNRQIHQFRYLISSQQAQWVREHFRRDGMTDAEALAAYIRQMDGRNTFLEELGIDNYDYYYAYNMTESARLHNKIALKTGQKSQVATAYPDGQDLINFKLLLHFHTEFILDELGQFLNEVDTEKVSENGVLNGASFNYASSNNAQHRALDIAPVRAHDPRFRKKLARQKQWRYVVPNRLKKAQGTNPEENWSLSFFNPKGYFAKDGQSAAERVARAVQDFENLVRNTKD